MVKDLLVSGSILMAGLTLLFLGLTYGHSPSSVASIDAGIDAAPNASASAPPPNPTYHTGDYEQFLTQGSIAMPLPDGGVAKFHDGNERPALRGCLSYYDDAIRAVAQRYGVYPSDLADIRAKALACMTRCKQSPGCATFEWPESEK